MWLSFRVSLILIQVFVKADDAPAKPIFMKTMCYTLILMDNSPNFAKIVASDKIDKSQMIEYAPAKLRQHKHYR